MRKVDGEAMEKNVGVLGSINTYLRRNRVGEILVSRGKLTPEELKSALTLQREAKSPLGEILIRHGFVRPTELRFALATQSALRVAAAVFTLMTSVSAFSTKANAGTMRDVPQSISVAFSTSAALNVSAAHGAKLFGTGERASTDLSSFTKWSTMFDRFSQEANNGSSDKLIQIWRSQLNSLKGLPLKDMASGVNDMMNKIRYVGDKRNWGKSDYWATPVEFLSNGGDCEDFAIAKYASLRALGVPDNMMRVAIVKDMQKNLPHAILIVYTESGPMVLDNQIKRMTPSREVSHYKPIFSINRTAWWLHTDTERNPTQIASAAN